MEKVYTAVNVMQSAAPNTVLLEVGDTFPSLTMKEEGKARKQSRSLPAVAYSISNMRRSDECRA